MAFTDFMERNFSGPASRKAQREEIGMRKKALDAELVMKGYDPSTLQVRPGSAADVERAQNEQTMQMFNALQGKLAAQETDQALLDFSETGDAGYLQGALDKNPYLKQAWNARGVQNIANLDWQNDAKLLARAGFNPAEYDTPAKQDLLRKNVYKFYDGTDWKVGLLNNVVRDTGAMTRLGNKRGQIMMDNFQNFRDFMAGPKSSPWTAEGHKYEHEINSAAEATGVPANLIAAMIQQESSGDPNAVSPKGAQGLMQLMPGTAKELGVTDVNHPGDNIMAGARYMAQQLKKYNGDTRLALAAYNAGPGNVDKYNGIPPFSETQSYVSRILGNYANAESYYNAGVEAVQEGMQLGARPEVNSPDFSGMADRQSRNADNRIATIQNFMRGNANAAKGTTNEIADMEAANNAVNAQASLISARASAEKAKDTSTATQKDLAAAENETNAMLDNFGGEEAFFATDFSDPKNFNAAWKYVSKIQKLEGTQLSTEEKKKIGDVRRLISLAGTASELSEDATGFLDTKWSGLKKYVSDNSTDLEAKAAMASFRNSLRHALFGSALTEGEIAAFNEAYGTNNQKLGPVLRQFKVALDQVKSDIDNASNLNNPFVMKVLVGADQTKLQDIQDALQQRIDYLEGRTSGAKDVPNAKPQSRPVANTLAPNNRKPIDDIFGGAQ